MQQNSDPLLISGQTIAAYKVGERIGRGGMGDVYRAHDQRLDRPVAMKMLAPHLSDDAVFRARFQREARVLASLNHTNIAAIYGLEESGGHQFLVMEWISGSTDGRCATPTCVRAGDNLVAVKMESGPSSITAPQRLFRIPRAISFGQGQYAQGYDVTADGSRFVASFPASEAPATAITVIKDWQISLKK